MSGSVSQFIGPLAQVLGLIEGVGGGVFPAFIAQLETAGLSETVRSWIGPGENKPVSTQELARALTPEQISGWAAKAGTNPEALLVHLSKELPAAVDRATPGGLVPGYAADA